MNENPRTKLVILGGGFGSYRLALGLSDRDFEVTVVSPRDHFLFTPLLASTTVGTTEFRSIIEPIRTAHRGIVFLKAACEQIDAVRKRLVCRSVESNGAAFELAYDLLVIGVGAAPQTFGIPGVREHALMLKELDDARRVRRQILNCVEQASLPNVSAEERSRLLHFVVVGGGPAGVEFCGELHDFITEDLKPLYPALGDHFQITLLEASDSLLTAFTKNLSSYARKVFTKRKIEVRTSSFVQNVMADAVLLKDGTTIPYGTLVWSTGVGPTQLVQEMPFKKNQHGRIVTDSFLRVPGVDGIYAIGDCATVEDHDYPMTGQLAQQEGKYLSKALSHTLHGKTIRPFRFMNLGMLAYIGGHRALADTPGVKWKGFLAWLLWRSVYITKLVSMRNKVRVLFDWAKTSLFGRDVTSF